MTRALCDAHVFISYLLRPAGGDTIAMLLDAAFAGAFTLLVADSLLEEFTRRVTTKPYLAQHISRHDLDAFAVYWRSPSAYRPSRPRSPPSSATRRTTTCWPTRWSAGPTTWSPATATCWNCRRSRG
ncbi:MAG TPA: hypothetical protein VFL91_12340 [Thermomicrobiales bacterium]|nr:hypothetical protein [Thermomicrobiales bacterium]